MAAVWLEVALNGPWSQAVQPGIPIRVEDAAARIANADGELASAAEVRAALATGGGSCVLPPPAGAAR